MVSSRLSRGEPPPHSFVLLRRCVWDLKVAAPHHPPEGVAIRILVHDGDSKLAFDEQHFAAIRGETRWQSPNYDRVADRYDIEVSGGADGLTIDTE